MSQDRRPGGKTVIWISPGSSEFSCLCEACLERGRGEEGRFLDAVREANVRGELALEADVGFVRCRAGHQLIVRRTRRLPAPVRRGERQLQLTSSP